ncbi:hypothetical protein [Mycoplasma sp. P36-A1]|uniref:hypothetical protein n=1 Tax=Mycoplasma sp. P36-A1 TaxID=3252900 RepID=UPI003C2B6F4A
MKLNIANIKRYLNYPNKDLDQTTQDNINKAIKIIQDNVQPIFTITKISIKTEMDKVIINNKVTIKSKDLVKYFNTTTQAYLISATLGKEIDLQIKRNLVIDIGVAYSLNAVATEYIEQYIDEQLSKYTTNYKQRFSIGYGDSPLIKQTELLPLIKDKSNISVLENGILVPSKSVTAFVKIDNTEIYNKCNTCIIKNNCQ